MPLVALYSKMLKNIYSHALFVLITSLPISPPLVFCNLHTQVSLFSHYPVWNLLLKFWPLWDWITNQSHRGLSFSSLQSLHPFHIPCVPDQVCPDQYSIPPQSPKSFSGILFTRSKGSWNPNIWVIAGSTVPHRLKELQSWGLLLGAPLFYLQSLIQWSQIFFNSIRFL